MALPTTGVMNALVAAARAPLSRSGSSRLCGNASTHRSLKAAALVSGRRQTVAASALFGLSSAKASEVALPETTAVMSATDGAAHQANAANVQTASLSRVIVSVGSGAAGRPVAGMLNGPTSVLLGFFMSLFSVALAVRAILVSRTKNCKDCKGYGIQRCRLCQGQGSISWEGKWLHEYDCPLCFSKRYTRCSSCGGMHTKAIFEHTKDVTPREPFTPTRRPLINPEPVAPVGGTITKVRTVLD